MVFVKLALVAILPVFFTVMIDQLDKKTAFGKLAYWPKQIIIGLIFGLVASYATSHSVDFSTSSCNVRDSAPICAGLFFGGPAGIIAGLIGGIERYFATYWFGVAEYTQLGCSIATVLAGLFAGCLRKYIFSNKRPSWVNAFLIATFAELVHMLFLFLTHLDDISTAYTVVKDNVLPMCTINAIAVGVAAEVIAIMDGKAFRKKNEYRKISQTFAIWLGVTVIASFTISMLFSNLLQIKMADEFADDQIHLNIVDITKEVHDTSDANLLAISHSIADEIKEDGYETETLEKLVKKYDVIEIDIINKQNVNIASNIAANVGFNLMMGDQSREFTVLADGSQTEYVQDYQPMAQDSSKYRKYAGVYLGIGPAAYIQVAYDANQLQSDIDGRIVGVAKNRHIGKSGTIIIADEYGDIVSSSGDYVGKNLTDFGVELDKSRADKVSTTVVDGKKYYYEFTFAEGYAILGILPNTDAMQFRDLSVYITMIMQILIFDMLFILIYFLIKRIVVNNINKVNDSLNQITNGDLNVLVDVRSNEEFQTLSEDINTMVNRLKDYIAEAAARIDKELEFARTIQESALPRVFPPFPNIKEFDIFADMFTAKEVGGDFYDFYMLSDNRVAFMIADVSGKGIPAAMFMMQSKAMLKSFAESNMLVEDCFNAANERIAKQNDAKMFLTAWMGILDIDTGHVNFVNAGHNPPLLYRNGKFEYLKTRANLVLTGFPGIKYKKGELDLAPGEMIFLYTDGVTEDQNLAQELYGEDRLLDLLNSIENPEPTNIIPAVKEAVDAFAGEAAQFDDITMISLKYKGK